MPRIYYRNNHIYGQPFENEIVTTEIFKTILSKTNAIPEGVLPLFELPQKSSKLPWKNNSKGFKYAVVWNSDLEHKTVEYGDFYMPKAIVFFDKKDAYFPSEYYFIVLINNELEISQCRAGSGTNWYEQPELRREVTDPKLIKRFEKSFLELSQVFDNQ